MAEFTLDDLWATRGTWTLHLSKNCCGGRWNRVQVRDHADPTYFDLDRFALCPAVGRADPSFAQLEARRGQAEDSP